VIVKSADGDRFLDRLPEKIVAVLIYGPDQGLVTERSERLMRTVVSDIRDPFRVSEIDGVNLIEDRTRLAAEAATLSLSGGRRVIRVRSAVNSIAEQFETYFKQPTGDALIVVEAGEVARSSGLRRIFDRADRAAAVPCYPDSPDSIAQLLEKAFREQGAKISADAVTEAVPLMGGDRGTIRQQIEKLLVYARGGGIVDVSDVRAVMGDECEARIEEVCDAAGEGDAASLDRTLERVWEAGVSPIAVLRIALGHFQRLALVNTSLIGGEKLEAATARLKPSHHFTRVASFRNQLRNWNPEKLAEALDRLLEAEALCKSTAIPAEAVCGQALLYITGLARLPG